METSFPGTDLKVYGGGNPKAMVCVALGVVVAIVLNIITLIIVSDKDGYKFSPDDVDVTTATSNGNTSPPAGASALTLDGVSSNKMDQILSLVQQNAAGLASLAPLPGKVDNLSSGNGALVQSKEDLARMDSDQITIGMTTYWPPYCYTDNSDPEDWESRAGILYEVAAKACEDQGLNCEFAYNHFLECWTDQHTPGPNLVNRYYDLCLCWTPTPSRIKRTLWMNNDNYVMDDGSKVFSQGFSLPPTGGFLVRSDLSASERSRLRAVFDDDCNGDFMIQAVDTKTWYHCLNEDASIPDATADQTDALLSDKCERPCPLGKITVGILQGWATTTESFGWIKNKFTGNVFDQKRLIFVGSTKGGDVMKYYNQVAHALEANEIDAAYVYDTVLEDNKNKNCGVCTDTNIWNDNALKFLEWDGVIQRGLLFSAGGPSGFFRPNAKPLRDAISKGATNFINKKEEYCPLCLKYFKTETDCKNHCIGCTEYCARDGLQG